MEVLIITAIIATLTSFVLFNVQGSREASKIAEAEEQLRELGNAVAIYYATTKSYPPDAADLTAGANGNKIPTELFDYLNINNLTAPWDSGYYDFDYWEPDSGNTLSERVVQVSLRFCPTGTTNINECDFPDMEWTANVESAVERYNRPSMFYCVEGPCQSHPLEARNIPGYCVNCGCKQMDDPACGY